MMSRFEVTCTGVPKNSSTIKKGKKYIVNQVGFEGSVRVENENHRNSWYNTKYFAGKHIDGINELKAKPGLIIYNVRER